MLATLPFELTNAVRQNLNKKDQKSFRLTSRLLNDISTAHLYSSVVFDIYRNKLDLSLLERFVEEDELDEESGANHANRGARVIDCVKELTIRSLNPRTWTEHGMNSNPAVLYNTRMDVRACEKRLGNLLVKALYALRRIERLRIEMFWKALDFVPAIVQRWFDTQLQDLAYLELPSSPHQRIPSTISGSHNCLKSLEEISYTPLGCLTFNTPPFDADFTVYLYKTRHLKKLRIQRGGRDSSSIDDVFRPHLTYGSHKPPPRLSLTTLVLHNIYYVCLTQTTLQALTPNLTSLHIDHRRDIFSLPDSDKRLDDQWRTLAPKDLVNLQRLQVNAPSIALLEVLSDPGYLPNLKHLVVDLRSTGLDITPSHPIHQLARVFFGDQVLSGLGGRALEELEVYHSNFGIAGWSFGNDSEEGYESLLSEIKTLKRLGATVCEARYGTLNAEDTELMNRLDLLLRWVNKHPCLTVLDFEQTPAGQINFGEPFKSRLKEYIWAFEGTDGVKKSPRISVDGLLV